MNKPLKSKEKASAQEEANSVQEVRVLEPVGVVGRWRVDGDGLVDLEPGLVGLREMHFDQVESLEQIRFSLGEWNA